MRALLAAATVAVGLVSWAFWFEPRRLVVREAEILLPELPVTLEGFRIAILTDLHIGSPHHDLGKLREIVASTNALEPDLVLVLGDLVIQGVLGGTFTDPEPIASELARLEASHGTYGVLGNHDWWFDGSRVRAALEGVGIVVLEDAASPIDVGGRRLWLVGVSDYWEGEHDVAGALALVPDTADIIAFTHNPDVFPEVPARVALTLAGHTHGGQVRIPFYGPPVVPSRYGKRYAAGHVVEDGRHLFVGTGSGTSILPVRFLVPPEVVVLVLRADGTGSG